MTQADWTILWACLAISGWAVVLMRHGYTLSVRSINRDLLSKNKHLQDEITVTKWHLAHYEDKSLIDGKVKKVL